MKMRAFIGIDPGRGGAAALIPEDDLPRTEDWRGVAEACDLLRDWSQEFYIPLAALEHVHSFRGQGVKSTFSFARNFGMWEAALASTGIPYLLPTPREWQKGLVKPSDGDNPKERSLSVARRLFPDAELARKRDHGRADALLMAWWAQRQCAR